MMSAEPGCGKSVVSTCAMAQMSCGLPVFGQLFVPRPMRCYYIPFERGREEIVERLKHIESAVPLDYSNIFINDSFIGYNMIDPKHADLLIAQIQSDCPSADTLFLDPIYSAVSGGLSSDEKASMFTRFSARLQRETGASIWMNHHTVKDSYSQDGTKIEKDDPFYGSQWLKAHCTAAFYMRKAIDGDGVILVCKKDSHGNLLGKIKLGYNSESYTSYAKDLDNTLDASDRIKLFLRTRWKIDRKTFFYEELLSCITGVSNARLRQLIIQLPFSEVLTKHKSNGKKTLYELTKEI